MTDRSRGFWYWIDQLRWAWSGKHVWVEVEFGYRCRRCEVTNLVPRAAWQCPGVPQEEPV